MPVDFATRPVRDRILLGRGLNGNARQPGSLHAVPRGAGVALRDSAQPRSSASPMRRSRASRSFGKLGRRDKGREEKGFRPGVEGMDARLLMAAGAHATAAQIAARIGPTVQQWMAQDHIPGMGVSVTYKGRVLLTKGYGSADLATGTPMTAKTPLEVGSATKTITAEAILLLAQDPRLIKEPGIGRLNLDAPISDYLRDQGAFHLPATWDNLTTRELLNMSSGIAPPAEDPQIPWYDVINASAPNKLKFQPGTQYLYSNASGWLVGEMIAQLSGRTYEQFVTDHVLRPLGMTHTSFIGADPLLPGQATGYQFINGQFVQPSLSYASGDWGFASGSIVSTAQDMGKYLAGLQRREILSPAMYKMMWTATPLPFNSPIGPVIATPGLGWDDPDSVQVEPKAGLVVTKGGVTRGYTAQVSLFQSQGYGISVLFNSSYTRLPSGAPSFYAVDIVNAIDAAIVGNSGAG